MKITEVRIMPSKGGKVKAFASIVLDDCFIVNDLRIVEARDGHYMVTMPTRKSRNGQLRDIAHPLNTETRKLIEERVLAEFRSSRDSRAVPGGETSEGSGGKMSPFDRLASRLLSEEFWVRRKEKEESTSR